MCQLFYTRRRSLREYLKGKVGETGTCLVTRVSVNSSPVWVTESIIEFLLRTGYSVQYSTVYSVAWLWREEKLGIELR